MKPHCPPEVLFPVGTSPGAPPSTDRRRVSGSVTLASLEARPRSCGRRAPGLAAAAEAHWRRATRGRVWARTVTRLALVLVSVAPAFAEIGDHLLLQGLATGQVHETDDDAYVLSSNDGEAAGEADILLWQALQLHPSLHVFAMEDLRAVSEDGGDAGATMDLFLLRWSRRSQNPFTLEAGKVATPIGSFPDRRFSDTNPLPGAPATYRTDYPYGIVAHGRASIFDYTASVLSLPLRNGAFALEADHTPRPAVGAGLTPLVGLRLGAFATQGPYLSREIEDFLPPGSRWRDFEQSVIGFELHLTRGYLVLNGEYSISSYEIPTHAATEHGKSWYLEGRYTHTPRVFTAVRFEQSDYPFMLPINMYFWIGEPVTLYDYEAGMGFRLTPWTLLKVSHREEIWDVDDSVRQYYPEGYAVTVQVSQRFDVLSWFDRRP